MNRQERYEEANEQLILALMLKWYGVKDLFWRIVPHTHYFSVRLICDRCHRKLTEMF